MQIVWGPEVNVDRGTILLHLIEDDGQEISTAWVKQRSSEPWAEAVFRDLSGELPINVNPTHVYPNSS